MFPTLSWFSTFELCLKTMHINFLVNVWIQPTYQSKCKLELSGALWQKIAHNLEERQKACTRCQIEIQWASFLGKIQILKMNIRSNIWSNFQLPFFLFQYKILSGLLSDGLLRPFPFEIFSILIVNSNLSI